MEIGEIYQLKSNAIPHPERGTGIFEDFRNYRKAKANVREEFKQALFEEHNVTTHPSADKCFDLAWGYGHSEGFMAVEEYFCDFVDLILP